MMGVGPGAAKTCKPKGHGICVYLPCRLPVLDAVWPVAHGSCGRGEHVSPLVFVMDLWTTKT